MHSDSSEIAEPNLTPILDMVFQLITFFMLVINFKESDFDKDIQLPVITSAAPVEDAEKTQYLILNLRKGEQLFYRGQQEFNVEGLIRVESRRLLETKIDGQDPAVIVVLRADRSITSGFLLRIVNLCKASGLNRFDFMVLSGPTS